MTKEKGNRVSDANLNEMIDLLTFLKQNKEVNNFKDL
jgi:hypothetical protein